MPAAKKSSGVVAVRSKKLFITPPGPLGFHNLIEPDDAFDALKFNAKIHFREEAQERLISLMESQVIGPLWDNLMEELEAAKRAEPKGGWQKPDARDWVEGHLKEPSEKSRVQLPSIQFANDAEYRDKDGKTQRKTMKAYDAKGGILSLPSLKLGMGSVVQAVLIPGLFACAPLINRGQPTPSFKLQGVRVIQLVQYGAGGGGLGEIDDEDLSMLGDDVEVQDLGSYAKVADEDAPKRQARPASDFDMDDEIPF
jgi:hypothetical protein